MELIEYCNKHLSYVFNMNGRLSPNLYEYEIEVLNRIHKKDYTLFLKSRSVNMSSLYVLYMLWFLENNESPIGTILVINGNYDLFLNKVFEDRWYKKNQQTIICGRNTLLSVTYSDMERIRFDDIHMILIDELKKNEDFRTLTYHIQYRMDRAPHTKMSVSSGASVGGFFAELWKSGQWYTYTLHYSKTPHWSYGMLMALYSRMDDSNNNDLLNWYAIMECIFIDNTNQRELGKTPPTIIPYKTEKVKNRIKEFEKQLYGEDI